MSINDLIKQNTPLFKNATYLPIISTLLDSHSLSLTKPVPKSFLHSVQIHTQHNYWLDISKASLSQYDPTLHLPLIITKYLYHKSFTIYDSLRKTGKKHNKPLHYLISSYIELCKEKPSTQVVSSKPKVIMKRSHHEIMKVLHGPNLKKKVETKEQENKGLSRDLISLFIGQFSVDDVMKNKQHVTVKTINNLKTFIFSQVETKRPKKDKYKSPTLYERRGKMNIHGFGSIKIDPEDLKWSDKEKEKIKEKEKEKEKDKKNLVLQSQLGSKTIDNDKKEAVDPTGSLSALDTIPRLTFPKHRPNKGNIANKSITLPFVPSSTRNERIMTFPSSTFAQEPLSTSLIKRHHARNKIKSKIIMNYMTKNDLYY